jgi:hypothetical protein
LTLEKHFSPLNCTFFHFIRKREARHGVVRNFCNEINHLEHILKQLKLQKCSKSKHLQHALKVMLQTLLHTGCARQPDEWPDARPDGPEKSPDHRQRVARASV